MDISRNKITGEIARGDLGKNMRIGDWENCLDSDGNILPKFQTYINDQDLQNAKNDKIKELEAFHESDETRILTINNTFKVSTNYETSRKWFNEIIDDLENESDVTGKPHNEITFEWEIATGVWLPLKLSQLKQFKYAVFNITKTNFKQYRTHIKAIEALSSVEDINSYDFTQGYLLDNQLTFDL